MVSSRGFQAAAMIYGDRPRAPLVAVELVAEDVFAPDPGIEEHLLHRLDHRRRPGHIVDGGRNIVDIAGEHALADEFRFSLPGAAGLFHLGHRADEPVVRVAALQFDQLVEKRRVLGPAVRIEQKELVRQPIASSCSKGALTMEKFRRFPLASVSGGSTSATVIDWPALKLKPAGLTK